VFFRYLRNQRNRLSVYNEFILREYTNNTIFIRNNTIQIQMTQIHAYTLITHEDGSIHHSSNYSDNSERHTTSIYHHDSYYYHHHILLASTITGDILLPLPHTTTIYHHGLMEIQPLHGVQQNVSPRSDTPPKCDASPLHPKSRQAKQRCCAHVIVGHEWSTTCYPFAKRTHPHSSMINTGGPALLKPKQHIPFQTMRFILFNEHWSWGWHSNEKQQRWRPGPWVKRWCHEVQLILSCRC
jgi:hypothetical protein